MKRYIVPLAFIVIGLALFIYCRNELSQPWLETTGANSCPSDHVCSQDSYTNTELPEVKLLVAGEIVGVVLVPSGVVIGIYRLFQQQRASRKKS